MPAYIKYIVFLFLAVPLWGISQVTVDFETGASGWTASGSAIRGAFVVANPSAQTSGGITTQVGDDHTATGVNAYFTATNTSVGRDDVDRGVSIATSPVYNIVSPSQLSIWYFFGQRDNGDDTGDFFLLEYSLNGGANYTNLVSIGDVTTNAVWTEATTAIPAGSNVIVRVSVSDGSSTGDIIEGGIDDLSITSLNPTISIDNVTVNEGAGTATFTATHIGANTVGGFTVNYSTTNGTATAGIDYTAASGTLNFNGTSGDSKQITIPILNNSGVEPNETFTVQLTATSNSSVDITDTATGTIVDSSGNTRPYEERYAMNMKGNFKMLGNTNLECVANCPSTPVSNNPGVTMGYVNIDGDPSTVNSSSSNLTIPVGASITYAGLYWGGVYNSGSSGITNPSGTLNRDQVKFRTPGSSNYTTVNADLINVETVRFSGWNSFMAQADITTMVQAGGSGNYFVADIALVTGRAFTGPYGGWTMVVIYNDPTEKSRNIAVWDGFEFFGFGVSESFKVTGLLTPSIGTFETHSGYFGFDGEANQTGDFVSINGTALSNTLNPNNNTLNGTISEFGVDVGGRNPNLSYSWGVDIDVFDATGSVPNSATDMDVVLGSSNEGIWGGVFVTSNEIAFPSVASKVFTPSTIYAGNESTVNITIDNPSNGVSMTNFSLTDNLPAGMVISSTPDASSSSGGSITASSGTNSFSVSGASIPAGSTCTFTFDVVTSTDGTFYNIISPSDVSNDQNVPLDQSDTGVLLVLPSLDSDNDGVPDETDLDDDNDGIFDDVECGNTINSTSSGGAYASNIRWLEFNGANFADNTVNNGDSQSYTNAKGDVLTVTFTSVSNPAILNAPLYTIGGFYQNGYVLPGPNAVFRAMGNQTYVLSFSAVNSGGSPIAANIITTDGEASTLGSESSKFVTNGSPWLVFEELIAGATPQYSISGVGTTTVNLAGTASSPRGVPLLLTNAATSITLNQSTSGGAQSFVIGWLVDDRPCKNTDGDAYIDSLDSDSDNDGCKDSVDAGFTDSDDDGLLGVSPVTVDANGQVVGQGGYSVPADNNSNGTYDFQENSTPTWATAPGSLDSSIDCVAEAPVKELPVCTDLTNSFFNEQQYAWGFSIQNSTASIVKHWQVKITGTNYKLDSTQLTNKSAYVYSEVYNLDGTYDHVFTGNSPIPAFGSIPGGNIEWPGVNFGFNPTSKGLSIFCGSNPVIQKPVANDCGPVVISEVSDVTTPGACVNSYTRVITYQGTNVGGNTSSLFTTTITVNDTTAPTASNIAPNTVFCVADVPAPNVLVVTDEADNCTVSPTVSFVGDVSDGGTNPEVITRTYNVSDECGNSINVTHLITVAPISITAQPINASVFVGNNATFSVTTANADVYQWQVSADGGASFVNINDSAEYTGTQTATLTVNVADIDKNNYRYRAQVSNSSSPCSAIISDTAILKVIVRTVITNRKITHRVKKN